MLGLHIADIVVLVAYMIGICVVGLVAGKMLARAKDGYYSFFLPRTFGKA